MLSCFVLGIDICVLRVLVGGLYVSYVVYSSLLSFILRLELLL